MGVFRYLPFIIAFVCAIVCVILRTMKNNQKGVSTSIVLETVRQKIDGSFPAKLRVTFRRKQLYYSTGMSFTKKEFEQTWLTTKPRNENKQNQLYLQAIEKKAVDIIDSLPTFTFDNFKKHFYSKGGDVESLYSAFESYIGKLEAEGRVGTASSYGCSLRSLKKFTGKNLLNFSAVDAGFLKAYERKMIEDGNSLTTVGIYARNIRALFNEAIESGIIKREIYPFGKKRYQIPASRNIKKAIPITDIKKLFQYEGAKGTREQWAIDMWKFSYLCNGMNIRDIANLKFRNIEGDKINFIRAKTEHTIRKKQIPIVAAITADVKKILDRWQSKDHSDNNYVFEILQHALTPKQERARVNNATTIINRYVKRIAVQLGIEKPVTTYTARHSFATILIHSDAPIEFIRQRFGHTNPQTTVDYIGSFPDETIRAYAEKLTNFNLEPSVVKVKQD